MGRIQTKMYYTSLVEHYFRMAVRLKNHAVKTQKDWFVFTRYWIDMQSDEDKEFIRFVFSYQFRNVNDGLYAFKDKEPVPFQVKRERLAILERRFAIDGGLFDEDSDRVQEQNNEEE